MGGQFLKVPYEEDGTGAGGYAKEMSDEYKAAEKEMLRAATADSDIIVATALIPGRPAPLLIPEDAVLGMKVSALSNFPSHLWARMLIFFIFTYILSSWLYFRAAGLHHRRLGCRDRRQHWHHSEAPNGGHLKRREVHRVNLAYSQNFPLLLKGTVLFCAALFAV